MASVTYRDYTWATFNPILVWFYRKAHARCSTSTETFNPILVWFYRNRCSKHCAWQHSLSIPFWSDFIPVPRYTRTEAQNAFNPILVWFYPSTLEDFWNGWIGLSIPFWSDFIRDVMKLYKCPYCGYTTFNPILVWFYQGVLKKYFVYYNVPFLSIPFWSDFIPSYTTRSVYLDTFFQSHFGLILSGFC